MEETDLKKELEINKKKLPKEIKDKINKVVFNNLLIAIIVILYFAFINLGYFNIEEQVFVTDLKVFATSVLVIAIILFEKAYKEDKEGLFLNGIEVLVIALITLAMPYTFFHTSDFFKHLISLSFIFIAIYYAVKALIICIKIRIDYKKSLCDVRDIVKDEKKGNK